MDWPRSLISTLESIEKLDFPSFPAKYPKNPSNPSAEIPNKNAPSIPPNSGSRKDLFLSTRLIGPYELRDHELRRLKVMREAANAGPFLVQTSNFFHLRRSETS